MSESVDGKVDYKKSYFACMEENEVLGRTALNYAEQISKMSAEILQLHRFRQLSGELTETKHKTCKQRDRLLTLAVKWCDRSHQDWNEIKAIYDECSFDDLIDSGGIADAPC